MTAGETTAPAAMSATATGAELVSAAVTALFVPGDRPERFAKAAASGADVVIIDLEDAVAPADKPMALASTVDALARGGMRALVRVNPVGTASHDAEVSALLALTEWPHHGLLGIVLPKAERAAALNGLRVSLPADLALVPLVESALGLVHALDLAGVPGVTRLAFGAIDFSLDINADSADRFLDHARSGLVVASRAAGIAAPLDTPSTEIRDEGAVAASAKLARNFGFGGKLCIHPAQIGAVDAAFLPSDTEIEWAHGVVGAEGGATQVDGQMIDRPVTERAKRILEQARKEPSRG
ncbi:putative citrate lyase beta chain [Arthrobacter globiformis NBRC 12137]|uniref:Putative citrate lyase beta chain n=1 Tax=Arthrobacter globiformis (strain ATCC 8010 / DSM 20124 / JCM 1332 / NBRC 12137 / NCIMB 8907 / NRRL B-2979 / 168) TaxID=1077972 RepID=H0QSV9_ARTG1|nr:CoA ester lyase [Arthrobacter globiformis]GAB15910.1 putative citrate lyase beta chain [Arthrobacter globiformis NBRC 12137]